MKFQLFRKSANSKSGSSPSNKKQKKGTPKQSESPKMNSELQKRKEKKPRQQKISQDEATQVIPKQIKMKDEKITPGVSNKKTKKETIKVKQEKANELPKQNVKNKDKKKEAKSAELPQDKSTETQISQVKKKETGKKRKSDADTNEEIKPKAKKQRSAANTESTAADSKDSKPADSKSTVKKFKKRLRLPGEIHQERMTRTVFIGNLPVGFNKKKLLKLLNQYGTVERMWTRGYVPESEDVSIKMALKNRLLKEKHPTLVGFASFKTQPEAETAIAQLNGQIFEDHHLRVTLSTEKTKNVNNGVFVGNLPFDVTDENFRSVFQDCGEILNVRIIRDKKTGRGKGFGYVNFQTPDAVELALQLDGDKFSGREIRIKRLLSEGKQKKIKRKKEQKSTETSPKKGFNKNQKKSGFSKGKPKDTQVNKKKKLTKTDIKKKVLAKKLITKPKTKE